MLPEVIERAHACVAADANQALSEEADDSVAHYSYDGEKHGK